MDYNHIKNYLDKFRNILFSKDETYRIISEIIQKNTSILIEKKNIQIKGSLIHIKASPLVKGEILMKKDKILSDLSQVLTQVSFKEIR